MKRPLASCCLVFLVISCFMVFGKELPAVSYAYGQEITITGSVLKKDSEKQVLILDNVTFCNSRDSNIKYKYQVECELTEGKLPPLGSCVKITGSYKPFSEATNYGEFDYRKYKASLGIQMCLAECVLVEQSVSFYPVMEFLWNTKNKGCQALQNAFPEKEAGIMEAILLGEKGNMDSETKNLFQDGGISHILAISGLHISFLGMGFYKLLNKLTIPNIVSVPISILLLVAYCIMCGGAASSVRATVMLCLMLLGKLLKRNYDLLTAMGIGAVFLLLSNPYVVYNSGFWLSFSAVLGFALFLPVFQEDIQNKGWKAFPKRMVLSLSGSFLFGIFSFPLVLYFYYVYAPYSMLLNLLVIPLMSLLLPFGVCSMLLAGFCVPAAKIMAFPVCLILQLYEVLCKGSLKLVGSRLCYGKTANWKLFLFYGMVVLLYLGRKRLKPFIKYTVMLFLLVMICTRIKSGVTVTFLDVGQGDGICIEARQGTFMIDGGSSSKSKLAKYQLLPFLEAKGIRRINAWFITHPDKDHVSGLLQILGEEWEETSLRIDCIILSEVKGIEEEAEEIISLAGQRDIPIVFFTAGDRMEAGTLGLYCLGPQCGRYYSDINGASLILYLRYKDFDALFMGDATEETEQILLQNMGWKKMVEDGCIELLKLGHHGSKYSSSPAWLRAVLPKNVIISAGKRNRYGHPHEETLARLEAIATEIYRTDRSGALAVTVHGKKIGIEGYKDNER